MKKLHACLLAAAVVGIGLAEREGSAQDGAPTASERDRALAQLTTQQQEAARTAQTYHAMDNATLLKRLVEQSTAKQEPFNSLAFRELKGRPDVDPAVLVSLVREMENGNALLPLLLLRRNKETYLTLPAELRARVLTDALQTSVRFNTWGLPGFYLEDASKALIETGDAAVPVLRGMLSNTSPAPVFGSQEYMLFRRYQFRLCDYALFFLEKIRSNAGFVMPESVAEREIGRAHV